MDRGAWWAIRVRHDWSVQAWSLRHPNLGDHKGQMREEMPGLEPSEAWQVLGVSSLHPPARWVWAAPWSCSCWCLDSPASNMAKMQDPGSSPRCPAPGVAEPPRLALRELRTRRRDVVEWEIGLHKDLLSSFRGNPLFRKLWHQESIGKGTDTQAKLLGCPEVQRWNSSPQTHSCSVSRARTNPHFTWPISLGRENRSSPALQRCALQSPCVQASCSQPRFW